jgi:hypothetical protein
MRRSFLVGIVPVLAFAAVTFGSTRQAHAGPHLDIDLDLGTALRAGPNTTAVDFSAGIGGRLGYRIQFPGSILYFQPEIGGKYMSFGFNSKFTNGYDYAGVVNGGFKFGFTGVVQPNLFAHIGIGDLGYVLPDGSTQAGVVGPAADLGLGLDFRLLPGWTLGVQTAFNSMFVPVAGTTNGADFGSARWFSFGLTTGFHFWEPRPRPVYVQPQPVYVYRRY